MVRYPSLSAVLSIRPVSLRSVRMEGGKGKGRREGRKVRREEKKGEE
jgi:hypothetical protein